MLKRLLTLMSTLVLLAVAAPGVASATTPPTSANPYPPGCSVVTTDQSSYAPGATITITAIGNPSDSGSTVTFTITLQSTTAETIILVVTAVADASGVAVVTITAPTTIGSYTVTIDNISCGDVSSSFIVKPDQPDDPDDPDDPDLPHAGSNLQPWLVTSSAAIATGLGLWVVARRRRRTSSSNA